MATDPTGRISHLSNMHRDMTWKTVVRVATTGNITLSGTQTIDGVACVAGNRVLVKNQSTASQNGIYDVAAGAWTRSYDFDQDGTTDVPGNEAYGAMIAVAEGTTNGGTIWRCTNTGTPTLGTTALTFAQFGGSTSFGTPAISYGTPAAGSASTAIRTDATLAKPTEADLSLSDVTTANVSTTKHGFAPKLPNDATKYLDGTGAYSVPAGGSALTVKDEGTNLDTAVTSIDFTGAGVTATNSGHAVTVNVPSGGSVEITEIDGSPDVTGVTKIRFPNGSVTNDGGGQVSVNPGAATLTTISSGTSFPGSPATGDLFYRTDLDALCRYDGTRWRGPRVTIPLGPGDAVPPLSTSSVVPQRIPTHVTYDWWLVSFEIIMAVSTTNNGSNFWSAALRKVTQTGTITTVATLTTASQSASDRVKQTSAIGAALGSTNTFMDVLVTKTGSPGNLTPAAALTYQPIYT